MSTRPCTPMQLSAELLWGLGEAASGRACRVKGLECPIDVWRGLAHAVAIARREPAAHLATYPAQSVASAVAAIAWVALRAGPTHAERRAAASVSRDPASTSRYRQAVVALVRWRLLRPGAWQRIQALRLYRLPHDPAPPSLRERLGPAAVQRRLESLLLLAAHYHRHVAALWASKHGGVAIGAAHEVADYHCYSGPAKYRVAGVQMQAGMIARLESTRGKVIYLDYLAWYHRREIVEHDGR